MAIVKMKKFTLLAFEASKNDLLKELQKFEDVHFKNLQKDDVEQLEFLKKDSSAEKINHDEAELAKIKFSMNKIEPYFEKPKGLKALTAPRETMDFSEFDSYLDTYDYESVYRILSDEDTKINTIKSEITKLNAENENLKSWLKLDVSPVELDRMKFVKYVIGSVNKTGAESLKAEIEEKYKSAYVEFLGSIKDDVTVLIMLPEEDYEEAFAHAKTMGFSKVTVNFKGIPSEIISDNNKEILKLNAGQVEASSKIKEMNGEYNKLQIAADYYETVLERERACQNFLKLDTVVLIEGWVPDSDSEALNSIVTGVCGKDYYLEESEVEKDSEEVPIKLKNNGFVSAFEDVTAMFSMPKYNEIDPTPLLMPFYMLFFGFMVGDAGYGLILLIGTSIALKCFTLGEGTRKFLKFFFCLSFATIFAGIIYGSMFGVTFFAPIVTADGSHKAILDSQIDVLTMMILSVAIGVFQIFFGLFVKGYMLIRDGKVLDAVYDSLFWIIALTSAIGLLLGAANVIPGSYIPIAKWGLILSVIGLAATQGRSSESIGGKIGTGLYEVYGLSGYVGDFVSYTRIAALALSGAYIAFSFNMMAGLVPAGIFRVIFGGIIVIIGQTLNLGLSLLGAYVHTCRLQYVEYFGKFYEGGGVPFSAFKLKNKFISIKK